MTIISQEIEVPLTKTPFRDGETLYTYAQRIVKEMRIPGWVEDVTYRMDKTDVSTHGGEREFLVYEWARISVTMNREA